MGLRGGAERESGTHRSFLEDDAVVGEGTAAVRRERPAAPGPGRSVIRISVLRPQAGESCRGGEDSALGRHAARRDPDDPELVHKQLVVHRERLAERLAAQERTLAYLEALIQRKEGIMPYDVQITEAEPQLVAATRVHTSQSRIGADIGAGFGTLMMALGREGVAPSGAPLIVCTTT